ncbi:(d)CMP kinase [Coprothermobacteraceae bacterium]|nr:(d)CMP kinase [Coprothermobacteraceae bacterium]
MIIAIDGLAGSGKTSAGRLLANRIGFRFISSGLLYRFKALKPELDLVEEVKQGRLRIENGVMWSNSDVTADLMAEGVGEKASQIALSVEVREQVNAALRFVTEGGNYVVEGRDIGSVVFPKAAVKFFLTADPHVRAMRRENQVGSGVAIADRDRRDTSRPVAPARPAADATIVDNTNLSLEQTVDALVKHIPRERPDLQRFLAAVIGPAIKSFFRVTVTNKPPLEYGRWLLTPNHTSGWDAFCLAATLTRPTHFVAKSELKSSLGPLLGLLDVMTIVRGTPDITAIKKVARLLGSEKLVVIYPEGHRYRDGNMGPFKSGAFYFLRKRMAPVVPVAIRGLEKISFADIVPRRRVRIKFLDPIFPIDVVGLTEEEIAELVRARVLAAYESL